MKEQSVFRHMTALILALSLCLSLMGCDGAQVLRKDSVPVQSVSMLMGMDLSGANRFCGVTEPKSTEKVKKDDNKDIDEIKVAVGQEVRKGDVLFTYDLESVRLSVESAQLEVEQLANSITSYDQQIKELEKDKKSAAKGDKLSYSLQIQEAMLDKSEAEYNLKKKQKELAKLEKAAKKTKVKANVDGVVQSINQSGLSGGDSDGSDGDAVVLTIVETGTYRVKGSANETNIAQLSEGMAVTVYSRTDYSAQWRGVISEIDTGSSESGSLDDDSFRGGSDENNESSARYSFYVQLDDSEGLMMGQHVYILPGTYEQGDGIHIHSSFLEQEGEQAFVWACSSKDTLERRAVTLGDYDEASDSYLITEGLGVEDYIALPGPGLSEGSRVVKYDSESASEGEGEVSAPGTGTSAFGEEFYEDASALGEEFYEGEDWEEGSAAADYEGSDSPVAVG